MKRFDHTKRLMMGILFLSLTLGSNTSAFELMGVDLERLGRDLSQEEEIVTAISQALVAQGKVQPPYKSGRADNAWPAFYQSMRTSASSWGTISIRVFAGRTIREVRVNMQGYRNRLPPAASFSHDWDALLDSDDSIEMRAGALGVCIDGALELPVRKEFCAAIYRAAMENPIGRARIETPSPAMSAGLFERARGDGYLDFRTNTEAVTKVIGSKALEITGYWNPRTRPLFYVGVIAVLALLSW